MNGSGTRADGRRLSAAGLIVVTAGTLLMMAWAIFPKPAFADGTVNWTGQGDNEPCDEGETPGFHWVFTPGGNNTVTDADLTVNGIGPVQMTGNGNGPPFGSWSADVVSGEVTSASVSFVGDLGKGNANLVISHGCFEEETTTTTTEVTTTTEPTTTTGTTTTETTTTEVTTTTEPTTTSTSTSTSTSSSSTSTTSSTSTSSTTSSTPPSTTAASTTSSTTSVAPTTITPPDDTTTPASTSVQPTTVAPRGTAFTGPEDVIPLGIIALTLMTVGSGLLWAGSRRARTQD